MKDNFTEKDLERYKDNTNTNMKQCIQVVIAAREVLMEEHEWGRDKKTDDRILDLYSALGCLKKELEKYHYRFMKSKTFDAMDKNQDKFTNVYLACSDVIEAMLSCSIK